MAPNLAAGIYNNGGTLTLTNSTVSGNVAGAGGGYFASGNGGGVFNGGTATLTNCTFTGNSANGYFFGGGGGGVCGRRV